MYFLFLAETLDPLTGGAGWVGTGLLGSVMGWLLFRHLPAKDAQLEKLIKDKDESTQALVTAFREELRLERSIFESTITIERHRCDQHHEQIMAGIRDLKDGLHA